MKVLSWLYKKINKKDPPYYFNYSIGTIIAKPIRKWVTNVVAANCPFNCIRIFLYRLCGFKIGKGTFIGMRCYLDDMCYKLLTIGNNVTISYGVFFACHGRNQEHLPISIEDGAYIGMRSNVLSKNPVNAGGGYHYWQKCGSWCGNTCKQGCSGGNDGCWSSLQDYRSQKLCERHLEREVSAA